MINLYFEKIILLILSLLPLGIILGQSVSTSFIITICILFLILSIRKNNWLWMEEKYIKILFLLYLYLIFNSIISQNPSLALNRNLGFARYIILIPAIVMVLNKAKNRNFLILVWMFTIFLTCLDVYFEFFNDRNLLGFESSYGNRVVSFFKDEPVVGGFLYSFFLIIVGYFYKNKKTKSNLFIFIRYLIIISLLISIVLTGERSNTIKATIAIIIFLLIIENIPIYKKLFAIAFLSFGFLYLVNSVEFLKLRYNDQLFDKINSQKKIYQFYQNNIYFKHYRSAIEIFKKHPFFGVGNKNYGHYCFKDQYIRLKKIPDRFFGTKSYLGTVCSTHPHQIYFELLAEHGIFGTIFLLSAIFSIILMNIKNYLIFKNPIHLGSIIFISISFVPIIPSGSFFSSSYSTIFWLIFSIMLSYEKIGNNKY